MFRGAAKSTHETDQACVLINADMFSQLSTRHPICYKLEGFKRNAFEGYYIWVVEAFPSNSLPTKRLQATVRV